MPELITAGASLNEAALNAELGLSLHLDAMIKDKDLISEPSSLDDIEDVEGAEDVARILVRAEAPATFSRI